MDDTVKVVTVHLLLLVISVGALIAPGSVLSKEKHLVFEGTVLKIGPSPGYGSGGVQAYPLSNTVLTTLAKVITMDQT